jgi:YggT family protein
MSPALAQLVHGALQVLWWAILVRVLLSWVVRNPSNPVYRAVSTVTDPLLRPLQRVLTFNGLDLSPVVLLLLIRLAQSAVSSSAA